MKRELAFAMEAQLQLTESLGRTLFSKPNDLLQNVSTVNGSIDQSPKDKSSITKCREINVYRRNKRLKISSVNGDSVIVEESKVDSVIVEAVPKVDSVIVEVPKVDSVFVEAPINDCIIVEESKIDSVIVEAPEVDSEIKVEVKNDLVTPVTKRRKKKKAALFGSSRRFTRSVLNVQPVEAVELEQKKEDDVVAVAEGNLAEVLVEAVGNVNELEPENVKKIELSRKPTTVKELFETGMLENYPVFYNGSGNKESALRGIIKGTGILCFCSLCKGSRVVPPSAFEVHACKVYKRASQYICFENGKSLLEVVKSCNMYSLKTLATDIQNIVGPLIRKEIIICQSCKGSFLFNCAGNVEHICEPCMDLAKLQNNSTQTTELEARFCEQDLGPLSPRRDSLRDNKRGSSQSTTIKRKSSRAVLDPVSPVSALSNKSSQIKSKRKPLKKMVLVKRTPRLYKSRGKLLGKTASSPKSPKSTPLRALSMSKSQKKISKKVPKSVPCRSTIKTASSSRWKITKKDQKMHRLVYEKDGLTNGSEVAYFSQGKKLLEGYKTETGIYCLCCNSDVSPSQFEAHAGWASRRKPYNYIYTSNGVSLHEYAVALMLKRTKNSKGENDNLCIICADGGNILLCDGCPRSFHRECASLKTVPRGKWYCKFCQNMFQREKFVAHNANAVAAGRVSGVDVLGQITERCIRIVKNPEASEVFACVLCRGYDFSRTGFGPRTVILCDQCEREYHVGCLKKNKMADLKELPSGEWFCCSDCNRIHSALQNLLVSGAEKLTDSLLDVTRKQHIDKGLECVTNVVKWRLLSAKISSRENKLLLSEACAIFHENFDPIVDALSGRDYIPSMVYGRNIRGQDLSGMYCAILTVDSTVVSAGLLRIFGRDLAELPLVATTKENQGKGYFQLLFSCIEKLLAFLSVRSLVLPAAEEAETIWTKKFGFEKIPQEQLNNYRKKCWQMLTFEGTTMLEKAVPQCRIASQELTVSDVSHQDQDMAVTKVSEQDMAVIKVAVEEQETSTTADKHRAAEVLEDVDATADIKMQS